MLVVQLDVTTDDDLAALADRMRERTDQRDGVVRSIGFAPQSVLTGTVLAAPWGDVATAPRVCAYSRSRRLPSRPCRCSDPAPGPWG